MLEISFYRDIFIPLLASGSLITSIIALVKLNSEEKRWNSEYKLKRKDEIFFNLHSSLCTVSYTHKILKELMDSVETIKYVESKTFKEQSENLSDFLKYLKLSKLYFGNDKKDKIEKLIQLSYKMFNYYRGIDFGVNKLTEEGQDFFFNTMCKKLELIKQLSQEEYKFFNDTIQEIESFLEKNIMPTLK